MSRSGFLISHTDSDPADDCFAIVPSDTVNFTLQARALWVGGAGDVVVVTASGNVVKFVGAAAGGIVPANCVRVNATGTTATNLVGLV